MTYFLAFVVLVGQGAVTGTVTSGGRPVANAVVWLEGSTRSEPMHAKVDQKHKTFIPHVTVITKGSTVDFPNSDDVYHNVFAEYNAKKFDLGMYPKGQKKTVTFDKVGTVSMLCNIHSEMSAYIVVVDTPYFAVTDKQGHFSIKNVSSANYVCHVWHESGKSLVKKLDVSDGSNLSLTLP